MGTTYRGAKPRQGVSAWDAWRQAQARLEAKAEANAARFDRLLRKEDAPCCNSHRDSEGRLPIGFCSPECLRRP